MYPTFKTLAFCAIPLLAACGGSTTTTKLGSFYAPVYTDGETTVYQALVADGLTGFAGGSDGSVHEIRVRFDEATEIVYVAVDGNPEIVYDTVDDFDENFVAVSNAAGQWAYAEYYDGEPVYVEFGDNAFDYNEGAIGLETAALALPTETATYFGNWNGYGETATTEIFAGGNIAMDIGFGSGEITGTTFGGFNASNSATETMSDGSLEGTISGTVTGSRIAGTMSLTGDATGEMDLMGAIYGEVGEYAGGGVAGSLTSDAGTQSLGGGFFLQQGCGFC